MKVGIYYKKNYIDVNKTYIDTILTNLSKKGIVCIIADSTEKFEDLDILIVLGGDGTILSVASDCAKYSVKIIGINYGHVGFLAEYEPNQLSSVLDMIAEGEYCVERRSMLSIKHSAGNTYFALNDAVIQRSTSGYNFSNTINLHAEVDGSTLDNFSSDGLIVSTPTGSTAYSLSAGGSVLSPDLSAFIITPICAHSLHSRPIVVNDSCTVQISRLDGKGTLNLIVDGKVVDKIAKDDKISISKSDLYVEFITSQQGSFFDKLLYKLNVWGK